MKSRDGGPMRGQLRIASQNLLESYLVEDGEVVTRFP